LKKIVIHFRIVLSHISRIGFTLLLKKINKSFGPTAQKIKIFDQVTKKINLIIGKALKNQGISKCQFIAEKCRRE
jgi:hypothetical protein